MAEREVCRIYGVDRDKEPRVSTHGRSMSDTVALLLPHLSVDDLKGAEEALVGAASRSVPTGVTGLPGAVDAVAGLSEVMPVGVASNTPQPVLGRVLDVLGIAPYVDAQVAGNDVERGKPAPDMYILCCQLLGVPTGETLVIEDSLTGILAAKAAGCHVVQVLVEGVPRFTEADHYIGSLEELPMPLADRGGA